MFFGALVSWASIHANPQAYGPLDSTRRDPRQHATGWAVRAAAHAASFPCGNKKVLLTTLVTTLVSLLCVFASAQVSQVRAS